MLGAVLLLQHPAGGWHKGETLCVPEAPGARGVPSATRVEDILNSTVERPLAGSFLFDLIVHLLPQFEHQYTL